MAGIPRPIYSRSGTPARSVWETAIRVFRPLSNEEWLVSYADGAVEHIHVRYGREVLAPSAESLPQNTDDPVWLIEQSPLRCLVREWTNPNPEKVVREVSFEPAPALLDLPVTIVGVTAAVEGE